MRFLIFVLLFFSGCSSTKYVFFKQNITNLKAKKTIALKLTIPDYEMAGFIVLKKENKLVYSNYQFAENSIVFYENYLKKGLLNFGINVKIYPWEFVSCPTKVYVLKILDYYVDIDKKEVVLKAVFNKKLIVITQDYKKNYLKSYQKVFDKLIKKIRSMV